MYIIGSNIYKMDNDWDDRDSVQAVNDADAYQLWPGKGIPLALKFSN